MQDSKWSSEGCWVQFSDFLVDGICGYRSLKPSADEAYARGYLKFHGQSTWPVLIMGETHSPKTKWMAFEDCDL